MQEIMTPDELATIQANNQAYLREMFPNVAVQPRQFTGDYWRMRNIVFYLQYKNFLTSSLYEALQHARIMAHELRSFKDLKLEYGNLLPYPENEEIN